jgi:hypothetical protein
VREHLFAWMRWSPRCVDDLRLGRKFKHLVRESYQPP